MNSAVVDTNVLVSGLIGSRAPRQIVNAFRRSHFFLITSPLLVEEFLRVTSRSALSAYISARERQAVAWFLQTQTKLVVPKRRLAVCRDPKDNILLEVALAGKADFLVTGDQDLLVLHPFTLFLRPPEAGPPSAETMNHEL